jgi:hypothetical protein
MLRFGFGTRRSIRFWMAAAFGGYHEAARRVFDGREHGSILPRVGTADQHGPLKSSALPNSASRALYSVAGTNIGKPINCLDYAPAKIRDPA